FAREVILLGDGDGDGQVLLEKLLGPMVDVELALDDEKDGDKAGAQKRLRYRVIRTTDGDDVKRPFVVRVERDEKDGDKKDGEKKVEQKTIVIRVPANADPETIRKAVEKAMAEAKAQTKGAEGEKKGDAGRLKALEALRKLGDKDQGEIREKVRKAL